MYENKRPDVAVFIDFENVYVSVRDKLNANPNFEAIMDRCNDLGRVAFAKTPLKIDQDDLLLERHDRLIRFKRSPDGC